MISVRCAHGACQRDVEVVATGGLRWKAGRSVDGRPVSCDTLRKIEGFRWRVPLEIGLSRVVWHERPSINSPKPNSAGSAGTAPVGPGNNFRVMAIGVGEVDTPPAVVVVDLSLRPQLSSGAYVLVGKSCLTGPMP